MLLLILTTVLLCGLTNAQQIIAYKDQKIGVGLNGDKFFSPEFQLKVNRHPLLSDYYFFEPSLGCKVRYYMSNRGYIYSGAFASSVYAYNISTHEIFRMIIPDIHLIGFEVYPFEKYFAGFSIFVRSQNLEGLNAEWAFLIRF
tara:strand:+ start:1347 stop:1775 length:429 start_codon:yes stop_codon:yes gene_type:complete